MSKLSTLRSTNDPRMAVAVMVIDVGRAGSLGAQMMKQNFVIPFGTATVMLPWREPPLQSVMEPMPGSTARDPPGSDAETST